MSGIGSGAASTGIVRRHSVRVEVTPAAACAGAPAPPSVTAAGVPGSTVNSQLAPFAAGVHPRWCMQRHARSPIELSEVIVHANHRCGPRPRRRGQSDHHRDSAALRADGANQERPIGQVERVVNDEPRAANLPDGFEHQRSEVVAA